MTPRFFISFTLIILGAALVTWLVFGCSPSPRLNCQAISVAVCQTLNQQGKECVIETGWRADGKHSQPRVGDTCYTADLYYGAAIKPIPCDTMRDAIQQPIEKYVAMRWKQSPTQANR